MKTDDTSNKTYPEMMTQEERDKALAKMRGVAEVNEQKVNPIDPDGIRLKGDSIEATFKLPCGGLIYSGQHIDEVTIRELSGAGDMAIMSDMSRIDSKKLRKTLVEHTVSLGDITDKGIIEKIYGSDMLLVDYEYIVIKLRQLTVGDSYNVPDQCSSPRCQSANQIQHRISDLLVDLPFDAGVVQPRFFEDFFEHPTHKDTKVRVIWHSMTNADSDLLEKVVDRIEEYNRSARKQRRPTIDDQIDIFTAHFISRVDRVEWPARVDVFRDHEDHKSSLTLLDLVTKIRALPTWLRTAFIMRVTQVEPSIDYDFEWKCKVCDHKNTHRIMPTSAVFFIPLEHPQG